MRATVTLTYSYDVVTEHYYDLTEEAPKDIDDLKERVKEMDLEPEDLMAVLECRVYDDGPEGVKISIEFSEI